MNDRKLTIPNLAAAVLAGCLGLPSGAVGQTVAITPNFVPGQTVYVEVEFDVRQTITGGMFGPKGSRQRLANVLGALQKVESAAPDELVRINLTFDRLGQKLDMPLMALSYDSDKQEGNAENPLREIWEPMLGESVIMTVDADGNVVSFHGMDEIIKKIKKSLTENESCESLFTDLRRYFASDFHRAIWGDKRLVLYANREVQVGETWTNSYRRPSPERVSEYTVKLDRLDEMEGRKVAVVTYTAMVRPIEKGDSAALPRGARMVYESGHIEGTAIFDIEAGDFTRQQEKGESNISILVGGAEKADPPNRLTVRNVFEQTYRVTSESQRAAEKRLAANAKTLAEPGD
jgi:hypothetical protein